MLSSIRANVNPFDFFSGLRVNRSSNRKTIVILGCLHGVVSALAILGFTLFFYARKRSIAIDDRPNQADIQLHDE